MPIEEVVRLNKRAYDGLDSAIGHGPAGKSLVELIDSLQEKSNEILEVYGPFIETPEVDGLQAKRIVRATFDPSANAGERTIGAHGLGVTLPDNAIIVRSWYEVVTTFTSATDAATIALGVPTDGSGAGIKAAVAISNGANPYDAGNVEGIQTGTAANFHTKLTAARELTATVAVEALTAGKLILFVEYVIGG